jgi:hypothetical protein
MFELRARHNYPSHSDDYCTRQASSANDASPRGASLNDTHNRAAGRRGPSTLRPGPRSDGRRRSLDRASDRRWVDLGRLVSRARLGLGGSLTWGCAGLLDLPRRPSLYPRRRAPLFVRQGRSLSHRTLAGKRSNVSGTPTCQRTHGPGEATGRCVDSSHRDCAFGLPILILLA